MLKQVREYAEGYKPQTHYNRQTLIHKNGEKESMKSNK